MAARVNEGTGRRAQEDEYFRRRDLELVEQARARAEDDAARQRLGEALGMQDEDILRDVQRLGYTRETVVLLRIVPLVEVAWADGSVSHGERDVIVAMARASGAAAGSAADRQLTHWLETPPSFTLSHGTLRVLAEMIHRRPFNEHAAAIRDLLTACAGVASASGGVFGFHAVSAQERRALDNIRYEVDRKAPISSPA